MIKFEEVIFSILMIILSKTYFYVLGRENLYKALILNKTKINWKKLGFNRTKTDTGGFVEDTKTIEIIMLKELGKLTP